MRLVRVRPRITQPAAVRRVAAQVAAGRCPGDCVHPPKIGGPGKEWLPVIEPIRLTAAVDV